MPGTFVFRPLEANITHKNNDLLAKSNPYCSIVLGDQKFSSQASTAKGGQHPIWKDVIDIPVTNESSLLINVMDKDKASGQDILGTATIDLTNIQASAPSQNWFPLLLNNKPAGEILLETSFKGSAFKTPSKEEGLKSSIQSQGFNMSSELTTGLNSSSGLLRAENLQSSALSTGMLSTEQTLGFSNSGNKRTYTEQREVVQPHTFTRNVETVEMVLTEREIEVMESRKVLREVEYTEAVPVRRIIETVEPVVVMKEVEVIEERVVEKIIHVVESFPVKKMVEVIEMKHGTKEIETLEPRTFKRMVEITEQFPVKKIVTVSEPVVVTEAVEFVEPVVTIQTITREILEPVIISQKTTQEVGAATLVYTEQQKSRIFREGRESFEGEQVMYGRSDLTQSYRRPEEHFREGYLSRGERRVGGGEGLTESIQRKLDDIKVESTERRESASKSGLKEASFTKEESSKVSKSSKTEIKKE